MHPAKTTSKPVSALPNVTGTERSYWAMRGWLGFKTSGFATEKDFEIKKDAKPYRHKADK